MAGDGVRPGLLPHRQLEAWLAGRIARYLEPRVEAWVRSFLASDAGEALLAETVADVVGDLWAPDGGGGGAGEGGLAERILLALVGRRLSQPAFRARLEALLRGEEGPGAPE
jgi:hypothetical protein